ncbi:MAG: HPr family phosphocarrier protein [Ignavibacteria bacterium CG_4_8_14_3_um_filter_37_9]|nr:HPr family phosphocarrier protein [Ignavibacteria bacterium]OIO15113.1 MAG: phosphocarrier protein HPr [Ignavibacteria bacterium CG1_02_37_35]PIP76581.1 MAG: phosphocarrier protein HPr [Ignavibacteria bacterium CG22_combo_CG10-13_8_21_14_all_37_15]PIS43719.1 MAG: HPr family phosphocarrier protein [Ignavibacteria bacterium CG08_land_8_20_14_0_20_37_9]PIW98092.1 MAG: HPr family phosphocarrier protein [Ignavibacteria bacterium CG_4_8_14_3_um_filter_37_9]PIX95136.1 MAG: HPr family phosphocarrie
MVETTVKIVNKAGLHTRPAATIVKLASKYKSEFFISKDGLRINGKSIIGVMTLAAEMGSELHLSFDGEDEQQMHDEIFGYIKGGFDEL